MMFAYPGIISQRINTALPFNILDIDSYVVLDSSNSADFTLNGSKVSSWANQGDIDYPAVQVNDSFRPVYVTNVLNGYPSVDFSSENSTRLAHTSSRSFPSFNRYSQYTFCAVFKVTAGATETQIFGNSSITANTAGPTLSMTTAGYLKAVGKSTLTTGSPTEQSFSVTRTESTSNVWTIFIWSGYCINTDNHLTGYIRVNGGEGEYNQSNNLSITKPFNYATPPNNTTITYGGQATNEYMTGSIVDFRFIPRALNLETIKMIEGYYATKYNLRGALPIGHPYKSVAPTLDSNSNFYADAETISL